MDPELLPGSGSGTWKIQSWIRIWNKSFRIHNTDYFEFEWLILIQWIWHRNRNTNFYLKVVKTSTGSYRCTGTGKCQNVKENRLGSKEMTFLPIHSLNKTQLLECTWKFGVQYIVISVQECTVKDVACAGFFFLGGGFPHIFCSSIFLAQHDSIGSWSLL